jgi:hypothetical protein
MNIPTYKANIGQYNVPSMNASGEFNNAEMIYEGVAKLSDSITKTAINMYEIEKAEEAKIQAAKDIEEGNTSIENLPTANTRGQQIYNEAAVDYYANSFNLETTQALNRLAVSNKNNAAGFLSASDSYLKGVSEHIPAHLKSKILYPIQVKAQSTYNTILKQQMADQETYMSEQFMFDTETRKNNLANLNFATTDAEVIKSNNVAMAEFRQSLKNQVGKPGGITAEYAIKKMNEANKGAAFSYVYNTVKGSDMDSEQSAKFFDDVVNGKTNNIYLNNLSPAERVEALNYSIGEYSKVEEEENRRTELLIAKADKNIDGAKMQFLDALGDEPDMPYEKLVGYKQNTMRFALTAEQRDAVNKFFSEDQIATSPIVKSDFDMKLNDGTLTIQDLNVARLNNILSFKDFTTYAVALKQPLSQNKKSDAWKLIEADIKARYGEKDSILSFSDAPKNARKAYIERGMNEYMAQSLRTADELNAYYDRLTREAKGIEGKELIIPEPIKKTIKAKIPSDDINEMALMYVSKKDVVENGRTKKKSVCDLDKVFLDVASMNPELSDDELKTNVSSLCTILVNAYDNMGL